MEAPWDIASAFDGTQKVAPGDTVWLRGGTYRHPDRTGAGRFIEVQATAEHSPFDDAQMTRMLALARKGVGELIEIQRGAVTLS